MIRTLILAGAMSLACTVASAQIFSMEPPEPTTNPGAGDTSITDDGDPNKVICRNAKPPTGTRLSRSRVRQKVCMTKSEWEQQEREAQEFLKNRDNGLCGRGIDGQPSGCRG